MINIITNWGQKILLDERMPAHTANLRFNASSTMKLPINPLAPVIKILAIRDNYSMCQYANVPIGCAVYPNGNWHIGILAH